MLEGVSVDGANENFAVLVAFERGAKSREATRTGAGRSEVDDHVVTHSELVLPVALFPKQLRVWRQLAIAGRIGWGVSSTLRAIHHTKDLLTWLPFTDECNSLLGG